MQDLPEATRKCSALLVEQKLAQQGQERLVAAGCLKTRIQGSQHRSVCEEPGRQSAETQRVRQTLDDEPLAAVQLPHQEPGAPGGPLRPHLALDPFEAEVTNNRGTDTFVNFQSNSTSA